MEESKEEVHMSSWNGMAVLLVAVSACAGVQRAQDVDSAAAGHWSGEIDRNGWRQPVSFDLERDGGAWRGHWQSVRESPGQEIENVEVRGGDVRFDTGKLRVVGHVSGATLRATVVDKRADETVGELAVTNHPAAELYSPGSEWSAPSIEP
jgi:hypothetical protein